jgi:hypothetical protein
MRVFKRPRSPYYYFDFDLGGQTHVKSTRLKNEREALNYAAAYRLKLIKQEVGIVEQDKPKVPTLLEFQAQFDAWIDTQHAGKPGTIKFYKSNHLKLLKFEPMRDLPLDRIDEAVIERFKFWALRKVGRTTVNRYLATLRKGLRYAWRKLKIIDKAPVIELYQNERQVEYVFDQATYQLWISNAEEHLRSASILARNSGITRIEMLNLEKDCVVIARNRMKTETGAISSSSAGSSAGPASGCSKSTGNRRRSSKISSPNPGAAMSSASLATPTRSSSPGYSNRKWSVSGKSFAVIRLDSIRMLDFTLSATRF